MSDISPILDYTSRDYNSIREDLLRRAEEEIPDWTNTGPADFAVLLIELFAHVGDINNYYIDRVAAEAFVQSAALRSSMLNLAAMLDYRPTLRQAATTTVTFTKTAAALNNTVIIPEGTSLFALGEAGAAPIFFTTDAAVSIDPGDTTEAVGVTEGTIVVETLGSSPGTIGQRYALFNTGVVDGDYTVQVDEGSSVISDWAWADRLIDHDSDDNVFTTFTDEHDVTYVIFGDDIFGRIPPVGGIITVTYRYGVGAAGNVASGAIAQIDSSFPQYSDIQSVTNATAAAGGADPETIEAMRRNIPLSLRSLQRGVTVEDFASLALQVPQVAKAGAGATFYTQITVAIAPVGGGLPSTTLKDQAELYLQERAMIGAVVTVVDPTFVPVVVTATVQVLPRYLKATVKLAIERQLEEFFTFDNRAFGERISLGEFYRQVLGVEGVDYVATVTAFNRDGAGAEDIVLTAFEIAEIGVITLTMTGGLS